MTEPSGLLSETGGPGTLWIVTPLARGAEKAGSSHSGSGRRLSSFRVLEAEVSTLLGVAALAQLRRSRSVSISSASESNWKGVAVRISLCALLIVLAPSLAGADTETEVHAAVVASYAAMQEDLIDTRDSISREGAMQFWSSGGLMLESRPDDPAIEYESFNVHPKHIEVILLSEEAAVALYYAEGSMHPKGRPAVPRYLTRVMEVYVLEDGAWKARAGHWSALQGGGGTSRATD